MVNSSIVSAFVDAVIGKISGLINSHNTSNSAHSSLFDDKQDELVSGSNIKTINNQSVLGSGNISISGGGGGSYINDYYWDTTNKKIVLDYSSSVDPSNIVTNWSDPLSDDKVPSEKLVKETIDSGGGGSADIVTSWDQTLSDTKVPSEKLVKNSIDGLSIPSKTSDLTNDGDGTNVFVTTNDSRLSDSRTPSSHTHGNITNDGKLGSNANYFVVTGTGGAITSQQKLGNIDTSGKIGTTSGKPIITTTNGVLSAGSFGTSSGTFAEGNHTHSSYVNPTIADNLTTNDATQVLSAKQGKILKDLIGDAITYINQ